MSPKIKSALIHSSLFIVTFITTTMAGAEWSFGKSILIGSEDGVSINPDYGWSAFATGLPYSICFLTILTCHEFGHYFTAVYYRVRTTLPYYIPLPPLFFSLGTLGALIRIKSHIRSAKENFDIGLAGPLAGFVVSLAFLIYGFVTLPPAEYVFQFHPEYEQYGANYAEFAYQPEHLKEGMIDVVVGKNLIYSILESVFGDPARVPNAHEIMHFPFLFAGFLSLVFTCINLLPIGQLDGGHVLYGLVGYKWHKIIATTIFLAFVFYAGLGVVHPHQPIDELIFQIPFYIFFLYVAFRSLFHSKRDRILYALAMFTVQYGMVWMFPSLHGYSGWLVFAFVIGAFIGVRHPPSEIEEPLDIKRKILGWLALLIFVLCFTPDPLNMIMVTP
jgi:membrane-associated protease RseP (regulator of RpoE activity)